MGGALVLALLLFLGATPRQAGATGPVRVWLGDEEVFFEVPPVLEKGRVLVPMRPLFEALELEVHWDGPTGTVTGSSPSHRIILRVGQNTARINDTGTVLDAPPVIRDGRTLVGVRFVAESLGAGVRWDPGSKQVFLTPDPLRRNRSVQELEALADGVVRLTMRDARGRVTGSATGFYQGDRGEIVTNYHVLAGTHSLDVEDASGGIYRGEVAVIAFSKEHDLAVIRIDRDAPLVLELAPDARLFSGQEILVIGNPESRRNVLSWGHVLRIRPEEILVEAGVGPGSSGSPLLDRTGQVAGVVFAGDLAGEGRGYAVPVRWLRALPRDAALTLSEFRRIADARDAPRNLRLEADTATSFAVSWDPVPGAQQYHIYIQGPGTEEIRRTVPEEGAFPAPPETTLRYRGAVPGKTYAVQVSAVYGGLESGRSPEQAIAMPARPEYRLYARSLLEEHETFACGEDRIRFREVTVEEDGDGGILITFLFGAQENQYGAWEDVFERCRHPVEDRYAGIARAATRLYERDVALQIVYENRYRYYPGTYRENRIRDTTIDYCRDTHTWHVVFPYLRVETYRDYETYSRLWGTGPGLRDRTPA